MPVHGIRADIELLALVGSAGALSFILTDKVISNVLFTSLISILFFMVGLHLDLSEIRKVVHHRKTAATGLVSVYLLVPALAFAATTFTSGGLAKAFAAIGISAAAVSSPVVFSNRGKGEGSLALKVSGLSLLAGLLIIPLLLLGFNTGIRLEEFALRNIGFLGVPLLAGMFSRKYENFLMEDMRHHFSKLAFWLLALIGAVQLQMLYAAEGISFLAEFGFGVALLTGFTFASFLMGYGASRVSGLMEREARTIGFVSGSKSVAVALFIAAQLGGEAVAFVSVYYFVRQAVSAVIAEYFAHGELKTLKRLLPF